MEPSPSHPKQRILAVLCVVLVAGCTPVQLTPAELTTTEISQSFILQSDVTVVPQTGNSRTLNAGSRWATEGTIAEGTVLKPVGTVLTIKGVHIREAYLVVRDGHWAGFWLPNEEAFVPAKTQVPILLNPTGG